LNKILEYGITFVSEPIVEAVNLELILDSLSFKFLF